MGNREVLFTKGLVAGPALRKAVTTEPVPTNNVEATTNNSVKVSNILTLKYSIDQRQ